MKYQDCWLTIAAVQWLEIVEFYEQLLQQKPSFYQRDRYAEFELQGLRLGIFKPSPESRHEFDVFGSGTLSLCFEVEDLTEAIAQLQKLGYPVPGEIIDTSHGREIYAYDPLGNRLILHQK